MTSRNRFWLILFVDFFADLCLLIVSFLWYFCSFINITKTILTTIPYPDIIFLICLMLDTNFGSHPELDDKYVSGGARSKVTVCRKRLLNGSPNSSKTFPRYSMSVAICFDAVGLSWQICVICSSYIAQHSSTRRESRTSVLGIFCVYLVSHNSKAVFRCVDGANNSGSKCCGKVNKYWPT